MKLKFTSRIRKGNNQGTGFIALSRDKLDLFNLGDWVRVVALKNKFFTKIISYSHRLGVYVPKYIVIENDLMNKEVEIQIEKVDGFYAKMYPDGRIYIPKDIVENQKLKHNDIVLIKGIENGKIVYEKYSKIHVSKRKNRPAEYHCVFDKIFRTKEFLFKIEKLPKELYREKLSPLVIRLLKNTQYAFVKEDSVIIFKGRKVPAIISPNIKYSDFTFYLGAYFSDGTRKGNYWAICASTFEQAKYYLEMHNSLIKDSKPEFIISYTNIDKIDNEVLKKRLAKIWRNKTGIKVNKFRIRKPTGKIVSKWNPYGTLIIREPRQILLDFYNNLLKGLIKEILTKENKELALDFLCGVMEGDGCVSATERGHIMIFTNKDEIDILGNISKVAQLKFKTIKDKKNKYSLRIGALEILRNFHLLKDKIFVLYPKRRIALFERLKTVGATKFLIGNHEPASWVKSWLKNNDFCDENYKITKEGIKLGNDLIDNIDKAIA
jgi:bifunctional DNA-binding transcriptional regulator/antitoxin component of YhaV-PrlF toxin-antitoxin module